MKSYLVAGLACTTFVLPVLAQEADDSELRQSSVIVSSLGPDRSAGEMVSHVTSLSSDELVDALQGTLGDTLDRQPGVSTTFFGPGASRPVLRGLGAERVLVLSDGLGAIDASAASPDHQSSGDGIDAERVEILRGAAALAYGGQAIGGIVNVLDGLIVENLPEEGVTAKGFVAGNTVNDGTEASGRVRYITGPVVLTASASSRDFGIYEIPGSAESARLHALEAANGAGHDEEGGGVVENSFLNTQTGSLGLSWVGDQAFLGLAVRKSTAEYGLPGHDHEEDTSGVAPVDEEKPFIDLEQTRYDLKGGITFDHDVFHKLELSVSTADYAHTEFEAPGEPGTRYTTDGTEARIELDHSIAGLEGVIGLQHLDKSFGAFGDEAFITPTDTQSTGVFVYETRDWDDGFGFEGGLRQERVRYSNQNAGEAGFDLTSAAFGLHKHADGGWFVGLQVGYTERAPNESELFADGAHLATAQYEIGDSSLSREGALNFEGSLRHETENSMIGASVFLTKFNDFVYLSPMGIEIDDLPVWLFSQQDADFKGFEIYGHHDFCVPVMGADWRIEGNIDYVEAELANGGDVPYLPPLTLNAELSADWGYFNAALSTTLAADQTHPGEDVLSTDGYALFGLRGELELAQWIPDAADVRLFADIRNLTDEEVRYSTSVLKDSVPAPGRNLRFGVKVKL